MLQWNGRNTQETQERLSQVQWPWANFRLKYKSIWQFNSRKQTVMMQDTGFSQRFCCRKIHVFWGCDNELLCECLPTLENCRAFSMSRTTCQVKQHHIPDDKNLHVVRLWECLHSMTASQSHPITIDLYNNQPQAHFITNFQSPHILPYINNANLQSNVEVNFSL